MRILIANRGEIARRIIRSAHRLGHDTVAAYADPDRDAPFVGEASIAVRLGPASLSDSYLSIDRLIEVAGDTGADAVHPGYGFLAENARFARAVVDGGLTWIGPHPSAMESMGSKIEARSVAVAAGLAVVPGFTGSQRPVDLTAAAEEIGYPVLVKAAAGGGGKGIRMARNRDDLDAALADAAAEAERAFGDRALIVERFIESPRHIEVQIVADRRGNVVHLGTRECSVQRRYQKLLEEAPAPNLTDRARSAMCGEAVELARRIGYDSAGTVEFIVDARTGEHFFCEMNTRLQVEHTVTEATTGLDIVELQLRSAAGEPLGIDQADVRFVGHAFEARVNAEDAASDFAPRTGRISHLRIPPGVRWDSAVELGSMITPHYDSMLAKLIVHGADRPEALRLLAQALDELIIGGVGTNSGFHRWLVDQAPIVAATVTTRFLDEVTIPGAPEPAWVAAATAWATALADAADRGGPWTALRDWRVTPHRGRVTVGLVDANGELREVEPGVAQNVVASVDLVGRSVAINVSGHTQTFDVPTRTQRWTSDERDSGARALAACAPFPGLVAEIAVRCGDRVAGGDPIVVLEAMKMLHTLSAQGPGVVAEVRVAVGDQVASNEVLVTFEEAVP